MKISGVSLTILLACGLRLWPGPTPVSAAARQLPGVDAVLDKYINALGGRTSISRHTTRIMKGTYALPTRNYSTPVESIAKAPNKFAFHMTGKGSTAARGFNGTVGWSRDFSEEGLKMLDDAALGADRFEADFYQPLHLRDRYPVITVAGLETLTAGQAVRVDASSPAGTRETMYFDATSGLLVRRDLPFYRGFANVQVFLDNYRAAGDVTLPFTIRILRTDRVFMNIFAFETIVNDAKIDDTKFDPPAVR